MKVKRLTETAKLPTKAYMGDMGYDFYADESKTLCHGEVIKVRTGIAVQFPAMIGGIFKDRSGNALNGISVMGGVIDPHYQGEVSILLTAHKQNCTYYIGKGQKIAQMILVSVIGEEIEETTEPFLQSVRGGKGFGSSGS